MLFDAHAILGCVEVNIRHLSRYLPLETGFSGFKSYIQLWISLIQFSGKHRDL